MAAWETASRAKKKVEKRLKLNNKQYKSIRLLSEQSVLIGCGFEHTAGALKNHSIIQDLSCVLFLFRTRHIEMKSVENVLEQRKLLHPLHPEETDLCLARAFLASLYHSRNSEILTKPISSQRMPPGTPL